MEEAYIRRQLILPDTLIATRARNRHLRLLPKLSINESLATHITANTISTAATSRMYKLLQEGSPPIIKILKSSDGPAIKQS